MLEFDVAELLVSDGFKHGELLMRAFAQADRFVSEIESRNAASGVRVRGR